MKTLKIILVRHGACKENLERRFVGVTDSPLDPVGVEQALKLARRMPEAQHLYLSPLIRCRQTAPLIWPNTPQTVIAELRETDFGPFEGKTHEELIDDELYNRWITKPDDSGIVPEVEDAASCALRAARALNILAGDVKVHRYNTVGVVSHGGTIMGMLASHGWPERDYYEWSMGNCGGFIVEPIEEGSKIYLNVLESF